MLNTGRQSSSKRGHKLQTGAMSNDENSVNGPREAPVPTVLAEEMERLLEDDQALVNEFVRNTLWRRYKYVLKSVNVSSHEGMIFKQFYRNCHHRLAKGRLVTKEDRLSYAKRLWDKVSRRTGSAGKKNIERKPVVTMINDCRNGVYTTMGARFDSELSLVLIQAGKCPVC